MALDSLTFDDLPNAKAGGAGISGLSFSDLPGPTPPLPEAATKPEFSMPGFGQITTSPNEMGFNLPAAVIGAGNMATKFQEGVRAAKLTAHGMGYQALSNLPVVGSFFADQAQKNAEQVQQLDSQRADEAARYGQLQQVHPGSTMLGETAPLLGMNAPIMATIAAGSYGSPLERLLSAGSVLLGNAGAQKLGQTATKQYQASRDAAALAQSQNAIRDATLQTAQEAGYKVPPTTVNPSGMNRTLESISGKAATQQTVSGTNADVTNALIRQDLGMAPTAPITTPAMRDIRSAAYKQGYEPIAKAGSFAVSPEYNAALDAITAESTNAAKSFPGAATPDVASVVDSYRPPNGVFDAAHAIKATQTLRNQARDLYTLGNSEMAKSKMDISNAIENEIERQLTASGQAGSSLLQNFQNARQLIAKTHTVEDAIQEGAGTAQASGIAQAAQRGVPLTGNLKTIGDFANVFPKANQKVSQIGSANVSAMDAALAGILGIGGTALPLPGAGLVGAAAPLIARPAARGLILSPAYQRLMARPKYPVKGLLGSQMLDNSFAPYAGGLLGYEAANR